MTVGDYIKRESSRAGRRISVGLVGLGITNRAVHDKLSGLCDVTVRCRTTTAAPTGCVGIFGDGYLDGIYEDVLFLSPSVRREAPALALAAGRGAILTSECEVFFEGAGSDGRKIFAVSGSDGKTTVTNMASEMLGAFSVGNIGIPYSTAEGKDIYVAELSSFNLNYFRPHSTAAVITSLSPNHLNWHADSSEYYSAKAGLLQNTERRVIYAGGACLPLIREGDTLFSATLTREELLALGAGHTVYLKNGTVFYDSERIVDTSELSLTEAHNVLNFMAALGLTHGYAKAERIREVAKGFRAPRHRCERVHTSTEGTVFIDSSIDTTPTRTATTLFGINKSVFLILGGRGKGLSLSPLKEPILNYASGVLAYGELCEELCDFFASDSALATIPVISRKTLAEGLDEIKKVLRGGETVVLSPAATAYGEFENFEKRGDFFTEYVKKLFP